MLASSGPVTSNFCDTLSRNSKERPQSNRDSVVGATEVNVECEVRVVQMCETAVN